MKLVELITTPECQHIYQRYFKIVATPKPPHQITSKQIYQEIVAYYNGSIQAATTNAQAMDPAPPK